SPSNGTRSVPTDNLLQRPSLPTDGGGWQWAFVSDGEIDKGVTQAATALTGTL
ncbi:MAG: hypothetical protein JWO42_902, partial [Chloroflexi bacterium]|nr:hypothetical protein [Chloroflexota bacterium]